MRMKSYEIKFLWILKSIALVTFCFEFALKA